MKGRLESGKLVLLGFWGVLQITGYVKEIFLCDISDAAKTS